MNEDKTREAVARAICTACEDNPDVTGDARGNEFRWHDYLDAADAALSASEGAAPVAEATACKAHRDAGLVPGQPLYATPQPAVNGAGLSDAGMPCGRCDVGVYDHACAFNKDADAIAEGGPLPKCKTFDRTCVGAIHLKDFRRQADAQARPAVDDLPDYHRGWNDGYRNGVRGSGPDPMDAAHAMQPCGG